MHHNTIRLVGSAVSSSNIASSGLSTHPVLRYAASNIRENGLRIIVSPLSVLLLLHSMSILRDDSDVANLVVLPWGVISKSQRREFPEPTQSIPVDTASNVIKRKHKYNRPRRRKRIMSCHGCKKVYQRKTWLLKHKETCVKMKYVHDRHCPRSNPFPIGVTQSTNNKQRRYSHIDVERRGNNINIDAYDARSGDTGHCCIHRDNGNM